MLSTHAIVHSITGTVLRFMSDVYLLLPAKPGLSSFLLYSAASGGEHSTSIISNPRGGSLKGNGFSSK